VGRDLEELVMLREGSEHSAIDHLVSLPYGDEQGDADDHAKECGQAPSARDPNRPEQQKSHGHQQHRVVRWKHLRHLERHRDVRNARRGDADDLGGANETRATPAKPGECEKQPHRGRTQHEEEERSSPQSVARPDRCELRHPLHAEGGLEAGSDGSENRDPAL
jgi:hypothetical protein